MHRKRDGAPSTHPFERDSRNRASTFASTGGWSCPVAGRNKKLVALLLTFVAHLSLTFPSLILTADGPGHFRLSIANGKTRQNKKREALDPKIVEGEKDGKVAEIDSSVSP